MFDYKPKAAVIDPAVTNPNDIGWLQTEFEPFEPNSQYSWVKGARGEVYNSSWKTTVVPKNGPPAAGSMPDVVKRMVKSTWKITEPKAGATRGNIMMGTRGMANPIINPTYNPQVRPNEGIPVQMGNDSAIATDWKLMETLARTNAVTFRGDKRPPAQVISRANGFHPPDTRTDRYYLENGIFKAFAGYFYARYNRQIDQNDFLRAVDTAAPSPADKVMFIDYMTWRMLMDREAAHLGRMASEQCLKGYISTSRAIDSSIGFSQMGSGGGWIYLTVVHDGFVVPDTVRGRNVSWGTHEAEIAQWGPIPAERIVGFRHFPTYEGAGPIFIRRSFRKSEPKAFETMFKVLSGASPAQLA